MSLALTNCKIFTSQKIITNHSIIIENGIISSITPDELVANTVNKIDLNGNLLAPGFIDTQVNGGAGCLFNNEPSVDSIIKIATAHRKFGTTSLLPTLISDDTNTTEKAIQAAKDAQLAAIPGFIGIHLEGPYLNIRRKGVHCETKITSPSTDSLSLLKQISEIGSSMVTLAPEVTDTHFIEALVSEGILVSIGHSNASYDCVKQALDAGATGFTHLFNAMSSLTSRDPGVVGCAMEDTNSWCGVIVDGHHVHDTNLAFALKLKPKGKVMLVTDAMHTVGQQGAEFDLAGLTIYRNNGKVTTADGTLAGSDLTMIDAVKNIILRLGIELDEALRMASLYPAQFLKQDHQLGKIAPNYRANLVLLDSELNVLETWIDGTASHQN
jgi:N-acetylglucosamine-6-phosphate deacetylase